MYAYKGVLHAGKYHCKKGVLSNNIKYTKIKIAQLKSKQRELHHQIARLEQKVKHLIDERNSPFLL